MFGQIARNLLAHPLTRGMDIDDPQTTELRRTIIRNKPSLQMIYADWYTRLVADIPLGAGSVLELGSGAGFLAEHFPDVITSDIFQCSNLHVIADGHYLPFVDESLRAITMTNVLHHMMDIELFLMEAARCVRPDGVMLMIEPWVTSWSKIVYTYLHHEPFEPTARDWKLPAAGPLSGANGALPWIVFARDRQHFARRLPQWQIEKIAPIMPLRYLVSGGVSMRELTGLAMHQVLAGIERKAEGFQTPPGMFAYILLRRTSVPTSNHERPEADVNA